MGQCFRGAGKVLIEKNIKKLEKDYPIFATLLRSYFDKIIYRWFNIRNYLNMFPRVTDTLIKLYAVMCSAHEREHAKQSTKIIQFKETSPLTDAYHYQKHEYLANRVACELGRKWIKDNLGVDHVEDYHGKIKPLIRRVLLGSAFGFLLSFIPTIILNYGDQTNHLIHAGGFALGGLLGPLMFYKRF